MSSKKKEPQKVFKKAELTEAQSTLKASIARLDTIITLEKENKNPQAADAAARLKKAFEKMLEKK